MRKPKYKNHVYIIAEIGMNHDGSFGNALKHLQVAAECGVDAAKFQMHIAEAEMLPHAPAPSYFQDESRWNYFNRTAFDDKQWKRLIREAKKLDLDFVISPFSEEAVRRCRRLSVSSVKIASGEVNNVFMLNAVKKSNMPVILSSGMSTVSELDYAVEMLSGNGQLKAVLQCSSKYPCMPEDVGLNVILTLKGKYPEVTIGLSDHTINNNASFAAVALGAKIIEKHFTLSKRAYGPDAKFSLEPDELKELVDGIRSIEKMISSEIDKDEVMQYNKMRKVFCKSIVARMDIKKGDKIVYSKLTAKKPGNGMLPSRLPDILNKVARRNIRKNEMIVPMDVKERGSRG